MPESRRCREKDILIAVLCAALLQGQDCGPIVKVVSRFGLDRCPSTGFALPVAAQDTTYELSSRVREVYRGATGTVYKLNRLTQRNKNTDYFEVTLDRHPPCTLDVAYGYQSAGIIGGIGGGGPRQDVENRLQPLTEVVARLVMNGSGVLPRTPASIRRF